MGFGTPVGLDHSNSWVGPTAAISEGTSQRQTGEARKKRLHREFGAQRARKGAALSLSQCLDPSGLDFRSHVGAPRFLPDTSDGRRPWR